MHYASWLIRKLDGPITNICIIDNIMVLSVIRFSNKGNCAPSQHVICRNNMHYASWLIRKLDGPLFVL